ncbi:MAG: glycosyl transferase family 2 [Bacteroidetes bacterium]|nr:glycosyl transferase family 2 [Bacteroidota bacterium]
MPDISVVIVNYNVKQLLLDCLNTICTHIPDGLVIEIIVVDNNSSDDSVTAVTGAFPKVIVIANQFNAGFSGANNQGMNIARGKFIFLLNPDTEIVGNAIAQLYNYMLREPSCVIVAPQLLNSDHSIQLSVWKNHSVSDLVIETFFLHKMINTLHYLPPKLNTTFEAKTFSGAALFFRKELVGEMGMLDEHLFWMEDVDFCLRAQKYGKLMYLHSAQVLHHSGQSHKKNYNIVISNQLLSKLKFYKKHFSIFNVLIANLSCFIFIISRLIVFSLLSPFRERFHLKAKAYFYTLKRFFKYLFFNEKRIV